MDAAKKLVEDLMDTIKVEYDNFSRTRTVSANYSHVSSSYGASSSASSVIFLNLFANSLAVGLSAAASNRRIVIGTFSEFISRN